MSSVRGTVVVLIFPLGGWSFYSVAPCCFGDSAPTQLRLVNELDNVLEFLLVSIVHSNLFDARKCGTYIFDQVISCHGTVEKSILLSTC
jgi:hypothetical protein